MALLAPVAPQRIRILSIAVGSMMVLASAYEHKWLDVSFWVLYMAVFGWAVRAGAREDGDMHRVVTWLMVSALIGIALVRIVLRLRAHA